MTDPLARLTGLSVREFTASHWDVAPLLRKRLQRSGDDFLDLLSRDAIDELLSQRGLRTPFIRMTLNGDVLPASRYTRSGGAGAEITDQVADDKVLAAIADGATLVLQGLHRIWPPIQEFSRALSEQLGHPVQVNAYVTPPLTSGLNPHYDVHDVFVLQFAGRKHWRVHKPVLRSPLRNQPWNDRKAAVNARCAEAPLIDTVLECGDMMYLPRGFIHGAASLGEISGHLTIGIHPLTRQTLADQVFAALGDDLELRRSLPAGFDAANEPMLDDELNATVAALRAALDRIDRSAVARGVGRQLAAATRPAPLKPLEQLSLAASLRAETRVCLRSGLRLSMQTDGEEIVIELPDKTVRFPAHEAAAVRAATSGLLIEAGALPGLDAAGGIALVARLLRAGVVVPI